MPLLIPPENGVTIRMYRTGHGDCFLLAFPRFGSEPAYILIDCGYKPGSQNFIHGKGIEEIVSHIGESTNHRLDVVVVTHEHQDHVNGLWKATTPYFDGFTIEEAWFAWTENSADEMANRLRRKHHDQLLGLLEARRQLALAVGDSDLSIRRLDSLLNLEFGGDKDGFDFDTMLAAATDPAKSANKQAIKFVKDKALSRRGVRYLQPGERIEAASGLCAFVLGPPRDESLLTDEDPASGEGFSDAHALSFTSATQVEVHARKSPFSRRYCISHKSAFEDEFFNSYYGCKGDGVEDTDLAETPSNAQWRRIDSEWLYSAEDLALKLNTGINNTSLVLAFELPKTKKVLFFPGDAQRGSWRSWSDLTWRQGDITLTARNLLSRTVLYKVGHHGSHNATLAGSIDDLHPNLSWMAQGAFASEFAAMITAVNEWALTQNSPPWRHPLPAIKNALNEKAQGRIFQTDIPIPQKPDYLSEREWERFTANAAFEELHFDFIVIDE